MKITGSTKIAGIFGDPIGHTLSPLMQNAAFESAGLDIVFVPFHVRSDERGALKKAVEAIRALNMVGVNVTIPHKEKVIRHLDWVDEDAALMGAVNTIVNRDGRLMGYNTDGAGYLESLALDTGLFPKGKRAFIVGAGGAARSIAYALLKNGASSVIIANRTLERAVGLAGELSERLDSERIGAVALSDAAALSTHISDADLVVNTTSLGMMGKGEVEVPLASFKSSAVVSDIVYRPLETAFLKKASLAGLRCHTGLGMLVHQGAIAFELWTGAKAPVDVMREAAMRGLGL